MLNVWGSAYALFLCSTRGSLHGSVCGSLPKRSNVLQAGYFKVCKYVEWTLASTSQRKIRGHGQAHVTHCKVKDAKMPK